MCAVIVIVGLGNGMAGYMEDSFAEMGTNTLTVSIMGRGTSRTVSEEQMYQIVEDNAGYLDMIRYCVHDRQCKDRQHHLQLHLRIRCRGDVV